jgi:hypothetical protein
MDPHCFGMLDPDPHQSQSRSQSSGAVEAQNGAI